MPRKRRVKKVKGLNRRIYEEGGKRYLEIKPGVDGETFRTDSAFKESRRAASEFGQAAVISKLIRSTFIQLIEPFPQKDLHNRISKKIGQMIRAEKQSNSNKFSLNNLPWTAELSGFEFNIEKSLYLLFQCHYKININRSTGDIIIQINNFKSSDGILSLKAAEYVRILAGAAVINFDKNKTDSDYTASDFIKVSETDPADATLTLKLPPSNAFPLFVVLGIMCFDNIGGKKLPLANKRLKALQVVAIQHEPIPQDLIKGKNKKLAGPTKKDNSKKKSRED